MKVNLSKFSTPDAWITSFIRDMPGNDYQITKNLKIDKGKRESLFKYFGTYSYIFTDDNYQIFYKDNKNLIIIEWASDIDRIIADDHFTIIVHGERLDALAIMDNFIKQYDAIETTIKKKIYSSWGYLKPNGDLECTTLPISTIETLENTLYPYIPDIDKFIDDFANSSSNVLILTGDPGLGKSSFIKYMLSRTGWSSMLAYDEAVMAKDKLYLDFIGSTHINAMVLEDSDLLLQSRLGDGNKIMSKVLNISDGILDTSGKKFIFTANIHNIADIDPALTRPGRCYAIQQFRPLTKAEAEKAAKKLGRRLTIDKSEYTVAELYTGKPNEDNVVSLQAVGFK